MNRQPWEDIHQHRHGPRPGWALEPTGLVSHPEAREGYGVHLFSTSARRHSRGGKEQYGKDGGGLHFCFQANSIPGV